LEKSVRAGNEEFMRNHGDFVPHSLPTTILPGVQVGLDHRLGAIDHGRPGPTVVLSGGMHGNEPAGVLAIRRILDTLQAENAPVAGHLLGLAGNVGALRLGVRYTDRDLNRCWDVASVAQLRETHGHTAEDVEQLELLRAFDAAIANARGPIIHLDLHSMSADGVPFIVVCDHPQSIQLARDLCLPGIAGLEKAIPATTIEYFTTLGHIALAVEGGQHESLATVDTLESVAWLLLASVGVIAWASVPHLQDRRDRLRQRGLNVPAVRVTYRHAIAPTDHFKMKPGYRNLQAVHAGEILAEDDRGPVYAPESGWILLPLYQPVGTDGFFIGSPAVA
jgi:succinylglutamate desuccinylase